MTAATAWSLLILFSAHLAAALWLGRKRRQWYYLALATTFALLIISLAVFLLAPDYAVAGRPLAELSRYAAWASAALSISWTLLRLGRRTATRAAPQAPGESGATGR